MSNRPNFRLADQSQNLTRMQKLRQRAERWTSRYEARRQAWADKRAARLERYNEAFRGSWISRIGLGLVRLFNQILSFDWMRSEAARRTPRAMVGGERGMLIAEALEARQLLAADITGIVNLTGSPAADTTPDFQISYDSAGDGDVIELTVDGNSVTKTLDTDGSEGPADPVTGAFTLASAEITSGDGTKIVTVAVNTVPDVDGDETYVLDTTPPTVTAPGDLTVECDEDLNPPATGEATADDFIDPVPTIVFSDTVIAGPSPYEFTIERTWTATDEAGNESDPATQVIEVADMTPPVFADLPDDLTVELGRPSLRQILLPLITAIQIQLLFTHNRSIRMRVRWTTTR